MDEVELALGQCRPTHGAQHEVVETPDPVFDRQLPGQCAKPGFARRHAAGEEIDESDRVWLASDPLIDPGKIKAADDPMPHLDREHTGEAGDHRLQVCPAGIELGFKVE